MARGKTNPNKWRWLTAVGISISLLAGIVITEAAKAQGNERRSGTPQSSLVKYATDLNAAAEQGRFNGIEERTGDTNRAIQILASGSKNNPVVISESQAIRDVVMIGVARRLVHGDVPEELAGKRLFKLNLEVLFHDSNNAQELLAHLSAILSDATNSDSKVILIIDSIQSLMGPGAAFDGAASSLLRNAMSSGQIQCFGASTDIAFRQDVASQESLAPLFTAFQSDEASDSSAEQSEEAAKSKDASNDEQFAGDNVSPDLRELIDGRNSPSHVKALLQVNDANSTTLRQQLGALGVSIDAQMPRFGILAVDLPTKAVEKLASNSQTRYLSLDRSVVASGHIENTTGEATMWSQSGNSGFAGSGVGIAILDSGITKMGGLDNIVLNQDFTGEGITNDTFGHGTFVASMAAANKGSYGGTAPDAKIINFRVLNSQGNGTLSGVLAALNAVLANKAKYNIRVVNLSLGMDAVDSYKNDPLCRAVRSLVNSGIVVVAAAGNDGKNANNAKVYGRIHSPGNEPSAITVGAVNTYGTDARNDDGITTYSSRGPTRSYWADSAGVKHYDNLIKPDLSAPGNKIIGNAAPNMSMRSYLVSSRASRHFS